MGRIKSGIAAKGVGLEGAAPVRQMLLRMLAAAIARGVEQRRRRVLAAERPVVADVSPDAASFSLALCQDRNGGVIAVQAFSQQNVAFDQRVQGMQGGAAGADQVSERREAKIHA